MGNKSIFLDYLINLISGEHKFNRKKIRFFLFFPNLDVVHTLPIYQVVISHNGSDRVLKMLNKLESFDIPVRIIKNFESVENKLC